jgi:hypothetical protein
MGRIELNLQHDGAMSEVWLLRVNITLCQKSLISMPTQEQLNLLNKY